MAGAKMYVDLGATHEVHRRLERIDVCQHVGADAVFDAEDALDLALDVRAVAPRLGHDLRRLPLVLLHARQVRTVEQHRVPTCLQTRRQHRAVRTMIEVQRDRHRRRLREGTKHGVERLQPDRLHRFDGSLNDERRPELAGGRNHRLECQVVNDVERRDAVTLTEGVIKNRLGGNDRQMPDLPACGLAP
jgi:hypothetical protein